MSNRAIYPLSNRAPKTMENLWKTATFISGTGNGLTYPLHSAKTGRGQNDIKRLQSGYYPVVADVDLHGYTQEEAQQVLNEFIAFVQRRGVCGEIIHGSGLGSSGYQPKVEKPGPPLADDASRRFWPTPNRIKIMTAQSSS